jgi:hypothetical protein
VYIQNITRYRHAHQARRFFIAPDRPHVSAEKGARHQQVAKRGGKQKQVYGDRYAKEISATEGEVERRGIVDANVLARDVKEDAASYYKLHADRNNVRVCAQETDYQPVGRTHGIAESEGGARMARRVRGGSTGCICTIRRRLVSG